MFYAVKLNESNNLLQVGVNSTDLSLLHDLLAEELDKANDDGLNYVELELDTLLSELDCSLVSSEKPFENLRA